MIRHLLAAVVVVLALTGTADIADDVIARVLENAVKLKAADPKAVPMAFWDFDGTIIKGDLSEGLEENGVYRYHGLVQRTIEEGFTSVYDPKTGWAKYRDHDYPLLCGFGCWLGWPFNAQLFHGKPVAPMDEFCRREINAVYRKWYFAFSDKVWRALEKGGVENYVVSASPESFVRNAAESLGVGRERIRGIRVAEFGGHFTAKIIYPLPFQEGKIENVREFVNARGNGYAIAGFGNSYINDAPFMRYIATQASLPGGAKGTAVMINGGKPRAGYAEHFIKTDQSEVVGK